MRELHLATINARGATMTALETAWTAFLLAWPVAVVGIVLKAFPNAVGKLVLSGVEQRNRKELARYSDELQRNAGVEIERAKAEIGAGYQTLQASVGFLSASHSGLRDQIVAAVEALWDEILALRTDNRSLLTFEGMFTSEEIAEAFAGRGHPSVMNWVHDFVDETVVQARIMARSKDEIERHRPFAGDRLWLLYWILRSVNLRSSWLMNKHIQTGAYTPMLKDHGLEQLFHEVIDAETFKAAQADDHRGFNSIMGRLEALFLQEAARTMSGSSRVADGLSDMHAAMLLQTKTMELARATKTSDAKERRRGRTN